jgi:hypothetical protein
MMRLALLAFATLVAGCGAPPAPHTGCDSDVDCASGLVCRSRACLPKPEPFCEAGARRCVDSLLQLCSEDGESWETALVCPGGCQGDTCRPQVCVPGTSRCLGYWVEQCLPDGSGWVPFVNCPTRCRAEDGVADCVPRVCVPFSRRCSGDDVLECDDRGTSEYLLESCIDGCDAEAAACYE